MLVGRTRSALSALRRPLLARDGQSDCGPVPQRFRKRRVAYAALAGLGAALLGGTGYVMWRLDRGGVDLDIITPILASQLSDQLGDGRRVAIRTAVLARQPSGLIEVEARDITIRDDQGRLLATLPRVLVGLDAIPMGGRPSIRRIDLAGASLALRIGLDGRMAVAAGPSNRNEPLAAETTPELTPFRRLGQWVDLIESSGLDGHRLAGLGLRDGIVTIDDARIGHRFIFAGVDLDLAAPREGGVTVKVSSSGSGSPWKATATVSGRDAAQIRAMDVLVENLAPRDLMLALQYPDVFYADTPLTGILRSTMRADGELATFNARIAVGAGRIGPRGDNAPRVAIDGLEADLKWQPHDRGLTIERLAATIEGNVATLSGRINPPQGREQPARIEIDTARFITTLLNPKEPAATIDVNGAHFSYDEAQRALVIERGQISSGPAGALAISGRLRFEGTSTPGIELGIASSRMPLSSYLALWPQVVANEVRSWVMGNVTGGLVEESIIAVNLPPGSMLPTSPPTEAGDYSIRAKLRGTSLRLLPGVPPLREADAEIKADGVGVRVSLDRALVETAPGRRLAISQGTFEVADHRVVPPRSVTRFRVEGNAEAAADILALDTFKGQTGGPAMPTSGVKGNVAATIQVTSPILDVITPSEIDYKIDADFTNFSADKAFGDMRIENGTIKVSTTKRDFTLRGEGRLGGSQATFEYRKPRPGARADIRLSATLDDAARARLGLDTAGRIVGPTPLKMSTQGEDSGRYVVDADLTQAQLADLVPGWNKARGQTARARFVAVEMDNGWRIEDLVAESRGVLIRGTITLNDDGGLVSANFPAFHLSDGDKASLRVDKMESGNGHRVTLRGDVVDARAVLRAIAEPPKTGPARGDAAPRDVEFDGRVGAVAGANGEVMRQVELKVTRRGAELTGLRAVGRVGRNGAFAAELRGQGAARRIAVSSQDAGATLRFLDIYASMRGGDLALVMAPIMPDGSISEGAVEITNFTIRGDRAVAGLVASTEQGAPRRAAPATSGLDGSSFTRLKADFTRTQSRINIADGLLWGAAIGATVEGELDLTRDQVKLRGTYVPAYALNNMFARIPLLGVFLAGAPDEGVIGITYEIAGAASDPKLSINPLSAVTPGFLRKMFEFRGRSVVRPDEATGSTPPR